MKRDDIAAALEVRRRPFYFESGGDRLFAWWHEAPAAPSRGAVAVICAPVGSEYTRSHRTLRHLADALARAGVPAMRFDYHGIGDSPGTDLDPDRLERWRRDVAAAVRTAVVRPGSDHLRSGPGPAPAPILVGVRLGATLAALASRELEIDTLVLWNPVVKGKRYARELQAMAQAAAESGGGPADAIESGGYAFTAQTLASLQSLDLAAQGARARRALVVHRDDLAADESLERRLAADGIETDGRKLPGWAGMMAEHQFTVVPERAIAEIVDWVAAGSPARAAVRGDGAPLLPGSQALVADGLEEQPLQFGEEGRLFGVLSRPDARSDRPAVLLFNGGAVHHVGPNRIYVEVARGLAAEGFACLRFDIEGIGDSVARAGRRENHPYVETALADARAAVEHLRSLGYTRFIGMGLCSGAHTAFHLGLEHPGLFEELVLINPLTYRYVEGMSLDTVNHFADAKAYRESMGSAQKWKKLLRGDVNFRRLFEVVMGQVATGARSVRDAFCERFVPSRAPRLARDLRRFVEGNRRVSFFIAKGDPGLDILMAGAPVTTRRMLQRPNVHLEQVRGDHTFSRADWRQELLQRLLAHLRSLDRGQTT